MRQTTAEQAAGRAPLILRALLDCHQPAMPLFWSECIVNATSSCVHSAPKLCRSLASCSTSSGPTRCVTAASNECFTLCVASTPGHADFAVAATTSAWICAPTYAAVGISARSRQERHDDGLIVSVYLPQTMCRFMRSQKRFFDFDDTLGQLLRLVQAFYCRRT